MTKLEQAAREVIRQHSMECLSDKTVDALRNALAEPELNLNCKSVQKRLATVWGYVKAEQAEQEPPKNQYNHKRIGWELERTAQGESYYGNALYVAMDLPFLNKREKDCLHRYMHGSETPNDRFVLQDIAMKVYSEPEAAHVQQEEQEPFDMDDHQPHRLCECRKCMEYFTPLPDCDAFAAFGKPIAEQEPVIECDCETSISSDGSRLTKCGSDQMRRAVEQGHAFCKQQAEQEPEVWYCPDCGTLSELQVKCCPDWIRSRKVPKNFALTCKATFDRNVQTEQEPVKHLRREDGRLTGMFMTKESK